MSTDRHTLYWRIGLYGSLAAMTVVVLLRVGGGVLGRLIGGPHTPLFVLGETAVFALAGVMLILFYRWPFGVVLVGWIDMVLIFGHVFPWGSSGVVGFFSQFTTDLIFFIAAHFALLCNRMTQTFKSATM
jgi:hypothetical protein